MTKDEALKMAIETFEFEGVRNEEGLNVLNACKEALKQPAWQGLNDDEMDKIYCEVSDNCVNNFPSELNAAWFKALKEKNSK